MTAPDRHDPAGDAWAGLLIRLADDDLLTGHVLTSVAGWGPELEINIALSSMGQDEIGHARRLYALVIPDRSRTSSVSCTNGRRRTSAPRPLARTYPREWEALLARQYLGETADAARAAVLSRSTRPGFAALLQEMGHEQRYHLDFWSAWLSHDQRPVRGGPRSGCSTPWIRCGRSRRRPSCRTTRTPRRARSACPAGRWRRPGGTGPPSVQQACEPLGLAQRRDDGAPADPAQDQLDVMLGEMRYVYATAPGSW